MNEQLIDIDFFDPNPYQKRVTTNAEKIAAIALSIATDRLLQPPTVRYYGDKRVQLAFGHSRTEACRVCAAIQAGRTDGYAPELVEAVTAAVEGGRDFKKMPANVEDLTDEQMFRYATIENNQREDLSPIELMEEMRAWVRFGYNSKQIGLLYGKSDATIRGILRLGDLPKPIQERVETGEITESNARRLLTLQRVAPTQVESVSKKLIASRTADPDQIIATALKESGNSVEMWQRYQSGEPKAGNHLWPLQMTAEHFPQKDLPELKAADAAKALEMELSAENRALLEIWIHALSSGLLRSQDGLHFKPENGLSVGEYFIERGAPEIVIEKISHLLNPPACSACSLYARVDGSHYCTFRPCYNRKAHAWNMHTLQAASKKLGIAVYDPKVDGKENAYISSYEDWGKKLVAEAGPDVRLKRGTNWDQRFDGVPDGYSIVVVGETLKKLRAKNATGRNNTNTIDQAAYAKQMQEEQRRRRVNAEAMQAFLWNEAMPAFESVLPVDSLAFLKEFADRNVDEVLSAQEPGRKASRKDQLSFYRRAILFQFLDDASEMHDLSEKKHPVAALAKHLQGVATLWGVKLPTNFTERAVEADKGIDVSAETEKGKKP